MELRILLTPAILAIAIGCGSEPAMVTHAREVRLIQQIRQSLLVAVEAEKSAVLSITDDESKALALESGRASARIEELRADLRPLIVADGREQPLARLESFDAAWAEFRSVDQRLLALAVANTNLKAARMTAEEGAAALDHFVDELAAAGLASTDATRLRALGNAAVAALRVQALLLVHIPSADADHMTRLEKRMTDLIVEVDRNLVAAGQGEPSLVERLRAAGEAWASYRGVVTEALRLSRENTNVISFDVSVHEKRLTTKQCLLALAALEEAVLEGAVPSR